MLEMPEIAVNSLFFHPADLTQLISQQKCKMQKSVKVSGKKSQELYIIYKLKIQYVVCSLKNIT